MTQLPLSRTCEAEVIRPIQYLGSKLRSIDPIVQFTQAKLKPGSTVLDIFTGSSVVAQALSNVGMRVIAADVMSYSHHFSQSLLGPTSSSKFDDAASLVNQIRTKPDDNLIQQAYGDWIEREQKAIRFNDADALFRISQEIPQIWRRMSQTPCQAFLFDRLQVLKGQRLLDFPGIVSTHYSGTYFGIFQAHLIDSIRFSIEILYSEGKLSDWDYSTSITALLYAASSASFTPGKHFAQYHKLSSKKDLDFHRKRIISDRSVDIFKKFQEMVERIWNRGMKNDTGHKSLNKSLEHFCNDNSDLDGVELVYADPPYTAQQYSRFYHIPEVISEYRVPDLQIFRGEVTRGLYHKSRFNSRFSSKRESPHAFEDLARLSKSIGADLAISYSESAKDSTGNSRMIDLKSLENICKRYFSSVNCERLKHSYRQFNSATSANARRSDDEILIVCEDK